MKIADIPLEKLSYSLVYSFNKNERVCELCTCGHCRYISRSDIFPLYSQRVNKRVPFIETIQSISFKKSHARKHKNIQVDFDL